MKVLVCGGRKYANRDKVFEVLDELHRNMVISKIVNGAANGADSFSTEWAKARGVPWQEYPYIRHYGKLGGPARNEQMIKAEKPDLCVRFSGGDGTGDMVNRARRDGVPIMMVEDEPDGGDDAALEVMGL